MTDAARKLSIRATLEAQRRRAQTARRIEPPALVEAVELPAPTEKAAPVEPPPVIDLDPAPVEPPATTARRRTRKAAPAVQPTQKPAPKRSAARIAEHRLELLRAIIEYMTDHAGQSPSVRDLVAMTGYASTCGIDHSLRALEQLGYLQLGAAGQTRRIQVVGGRWQCDPDVLARAEAELAGEARPSKEEP
ncbi:MAG: hypothetical protein JXB47_20840 [Anaerolineae bacterium]|nr:hypothetical protein [Anaerolineae bacterium]